MTNEHIEDMTDADATAAIEDFLRGRAEAGVQLAQAAARVSLRDGELVVIFDPTLAGAEQWALLEVQPFKSLAHFVASPLQDETPRGAGLRSRIRTIHAAMIDGTSVGDLEVDSLHIG